MEEVVDRWAIPCSGHVIHQRTGQEVHREVWVLKVGRKLEELIRNRSLLWGSCDGKLYPKVEVGSRGNDIRCNRGSWQGFLLYWEFQEF
jgi:hypothetical protein